MPNKNEVISRGHPSHKRRLSQQSVSVAARVALRLPAPVPRWVEGLHAAEMKLTFASKSIS